MKENIITLTDGENFETWGSITEICQKKGFSYNYLKRLKFPFTYKGVRFIKTPFRQENGVKTKEKAR